MTLYKEWLGPNLHLLEYFCMPYLDTLHFLYTSGGKKKNTNKISNLTFMDPCIILQFIKKNPTRCNNVSNFIITCLYEPQHVSGDTPPIIMSLKLHWQPLVFSYVEGCWTCSWWTLSGTYCA